MKLAVVVQRYGSDVNGGAELHARYIAEHLANHAEVEVLTTCARDYVSWRNEFDPGEDRVGNLLVRRFPVRHPRDPLIFDRWSHRVFEHRHSVAHELAWLESEGPTSPQLIRHLRRNASTYDFFLFFSYRYAHAYHGCRAVGPRAVLVPTAERDPAIGLSIFGPIFRGVRGIMYNSFEERAMIQAVAGNSKVRHTVVGVGSEIPSNIDADRFRQKFDIQQPFIVYIGRLDENKGCPELFQFFRNYASRVSGSLQLVLIGRSILQIPSHPRIRQLGFVSDQDKFDALAAAHALVMPSKFESLSMVALEAWAMGRPVLANGSCDVLQGQCIRSKAGLYYKNYEEFAETLHALETNRPLHTALSVNGSEYFQRHYSWPVIERKYLEVLNHLKREEAQRMEPLPGWFGRRRSNIAPTRKTVDALPTGPALKFNRGSRAARRG